MPEPNNPIDRTAIAFQGYMDIYEREWKLDANRVYYMNLPQKFMML